MVELLVCAERGNISFYTCLINTANCDPALAELTFRNTVFKSTQKAAAEADVPPRYLTGIPTVQARCFLGNSLSTVLGSSQRPLPPPVALETCRLRPSQPLTLTDQRPRAEPPASSEEGLSLLSLSFFLYLFSFVSR